MEDILQAIQSMDAQMLLAGLALVLFLFVVLLRSLFSGPKGDAILLVGPCDAGKTTLFLQLRDKSTHNGAVASMEANEAKVLLPSDKPSARPVKIIDIPGHPRLRRKFDTYSGSARAIIFVVDSVDFMPKKTEAAEQLYDVLTNNSVTQRRLPVLLACNKADAGNRAHTVDFIKKRLEKEIDQMRSTRGALANEQGSSQASLLGTPGEAFSFEGLAKGGKGIPVSAAAVSALDVGGLADVELFIRKYCP